MITNGRIETSVFGIFIVSDIMVQTVGHITNAVGDEAIAAVMTEEYFEKHNLVERD